MSNEIKNDQIDESLLLEVSKIEKSFPGVKAIKEANLSVKRGEIHALIGENGAGKSTLIKILTGVFPPDSGEMSFNDKAGFPSSPLKASRSGIGTIYQEFTLIPNLKVSENIFLGREKNLNGFIDKEYEYKNSKSIFETLGVRIDPDSIAANLNVSQQQIVEIARALLLDSKLLIMDEPTASLTPSEVKNLFEILGDLKENGIGIIFISHRLDEVFEIADKVTIMRDGETVGCWNIGDLDRNRMIETMVGRSLDQEFPKVDHNIGEVSLKVENITGKGVKETSFVAKKGEILGLFGLVGAGRTALARVIFGADRLDNGNVQLNGLDLQIKGPFDAIANGICLLTEDRKAEGLILGLSGIENFALPNLNRWSKFGFINETDEKNRFLEYVKSLKIKISGPDQEAKNLSGGNQQKLLIARWLESNSEVLIFDEPTRGIDVGAKYEIYNLMNELAAAGKTVIMISSELTEIMGMSDRILVMNQGAITGEIEDVEGCSQEDIMKLAIH